MKRFVIKLAAVLVAIAMVILPVSVAIDPYNVFHYMNPRDNGVEANKGFIKTKYLIKNHDKFDSLVFGSSRAGFVDVLYLNEKTGNKFYNMASSESLVSEQTRELRVLIKSGFVPKKVWVFVDDISCFVDPLLHENMLYRVPYPEGLFETAEFYLKYVDLITVYNSCKVINDYKEKVLNEGKSLDEYTFDHYANMNYIERYHNTGCERLDKESKFDINSPQYNEAYWCDYYKLRLDEALTDMRELKMLCDEYGIELTVITNPLYCLTFDKAYENGYADYLYALSDITDYYNFSGHTYVSKDYQYYYETSHYTPQVSRLMIDAVLGNGDNGNDELFGMHVTKDNKDLLIERLTE